MAGRSAVGYSFGMGAVALLACVFVLAWHPAVASGTAAPSTSEVVRLVARYAMGDPPAADPLLMLDNGVQVKRSHWEGVMVGAQRYYYRLRESMNFDPVSRGVNEDPEVVAVVNAGTYAEMEIYWLK